MNRDVRLLFSSRLLVCNYTLSSNVLIRVASLALEFIERFLQEKKLIFMFYEYVIVVHLYYQPLKRYLFELV